MSEHWRIMLILGPSGAGKSSFGRYLSERRNWLHLEMDQFPSGDGIDLHNLRLPWDRFVNQRDPGDLREALICRIREGGCPGVALSFPSRVVLQLHHIETAALAGIQTVYLYGTAADCIASFLAREQFIGRNLHAGHWVRNNARIYFLVSLPVLARFRKQVFNENGSRRNWEDIYNEIYESS